jgi:hypothetical protein
LLSKEIARLKSALEATIDEESKLEFNYKESLETIDAYDSDSKLDLKVNFLFIPKIKNCSWLYNSENR